MFTEEILTHLFTSSPCLPRFAHKCFTVCDAPLSLWPHIVHPPLVDLRTCLPRWFGFTDLADQWAQKSCLRIVPLHYSLHGKTCSLRIVPTLNNPVLALAWEGRPHVMDISTFRVTVVSQDVGDHLVPHFIFLLRKKFCIKSKFSGIQLKIGIQGSLSTWGLTVGIALSFSLSWKFFTTHWSHWLYFGEYCPLF